MHFPSKSTSDILTTFVLKPIPMPTLYDKRQRPNANADTPIPRGKQKRYAKFPAFCIVVRQFTHIDIKILSALTGLPSKHILSTNRLHTLCPTPTTHLPLIRQ